MPEKPRFWVCAWWNRDRLRVGVSLLFCPPLLTVNLLVGGFEVGWI